MSVFDAEKFLNHETTEETDTVLIPIPVGEWQGQINNIKFREIMAKNTGETHTLMDIVWEILDDDVKKETKMVKPTCRQTIFLELTSEGNIDMAKGKNVQIGRLREAVKQNKAGKAWSPAKLMGQVALVKTIQRVDGEDSTKIFSEVKQVAAL